MMQKFNKLYNQIITECKRRPIKRKKVKVKNVPTTKNVDQFCRVTRKPIVTSLTQE